MSAFMVTPETINAVCHWYNFNNQCSHFNFENGVKILIDENIKSLAYRYPDTKGKEIESFLPNYDYESYIKKAQIINEL